jgi:SHS2 domain-containing protein
MFEILEHTADIGFRAYGRTMAELFAAAAEALVSIALDTENVVPRSERSIRANGSDWESLLVNWLSEVLYYTDGEQFAFRRFRVDEISPEAASGVGVGEPRDPARHSAKLIIKGVTYHQLKIVATEDGWYADVYLDI